MIDIKGKIDRTTEVIKSTHNLILACIPLGVIAGAGGAYTLLNGDDVTLAVENTHGIVEVVVEHWVDEDGKVHVRQEGNKVFISVAE